MTDAPRPLPAVSRRGFLLATAGGLGGLALSAGSVTAAHAAVTPKLPGEYYRKGNQRTAAGTLFDNISVRINGDVARIHVPQSLDVAGRAPVQVVWFYHGAGTDHNALDGGYKQHAAMVVDRGAVAICQTAGGTLYANPTAVSLQAAGASYMSSVFNITTSALRATSGGGCLAIEAYAARLIPDIAGMYLVNATYDTMAMYNQGDRAREGVIAAYGDDPSAIQAGNPARYPASAWAGARFRVIVSQPDETDITVPPSQHGLALRNLALPVAEEASLRAHSNGHSTPGFALTDFRDALDRWPHGARPDTTPPSVSITSPADGAVLKGTVTIKAAASDDVGVVDVAIYVGATRMLALKKASDGSWGATLNTKTSKTPNGTYAMTARATDQAGNVGTSAVVTVRVAN